MHHSAKFLKVLFVSLFISTLLYPGTAFSESKAQTKCPVSGDPVKESIYFDHAGKRIYACCKKCRKKIAKDPEAALKRIKENGETAADAPAN